MNIPTSEMMHTLIINGEERQFSPQETPRTLSALLTRLGVAEATVVAEVDGQLVRARDFASTPIRDGHHIELVRFVGGG